MRTLIIFALLAFTAAASLTAVTTTPAHACHEPIPTVAVGRDGAMRRTAVLTLRADGVGVLGGSMPVFKSKK